MQPIFVNRSKQQVHVDAIGSNIHVHSMSLDDLANSNLNGTYHIEFIHTKMCIHVHVHEKGVCKANQWTAVSGWLALISVCVVAL